MDEQNSARRASTPESIGSEAAADQSDVMRGTEPIPAEKPSQAEGERETVDQSIREHEASGELF